MGKLIELVSPAPGFRAAVNLEMDLEDLQKAGGYIPTQRSMDVIHDVSRQLEPTATARARIITGTYGTGKSHLALLLANLYRGYGEHAALGPLWQRLAAGPWAGRASKTRQSVRDMPCPFLVVTLEGPHPDIEGALLRGLERALQKAGLATVMPTTYYHAAVTRLEELTTDSSAVERLQAGLDSAGVAGVESLKAQLTEALPQAFDQFQAVHRHVCFGAEFNILGACKADEVFVEVAQELRSKGSHQGIVVFWDEFGQMMERIANEPAGSAGASVQRFAEACGRPENGLHLYLICHRALESYVALAGDARRLPSAIRKSWEDDWQKVAGRFHHWPLHNQPNELFNLIDQVLVQDGDLWEELARQHNDELEELTETAHDLELFPDFRFTDLRKIVVEGSYPLHPLTACLLPAVSEVVAQNERTLFTFLCDDGPNTVGAFLKEQPAPSEAEALPLVAPSALWDYFALQIEADREVGQRVYSLYRQAAARLGAADEHSVNLLKTVALTQLVQEGKPGAPDLPQATEEVLRFGFWAADLDEAGLAERLRRFVQAGPDRIATKTRDGAYRLIGGGATDLDERLAEVKEERQTRLSVGSFVRAAWGDADLLNLMTDIEARQREAAYTVPRHARVLPVTVEELERPDRWIQNLRGAEYWDGVVFVALAEHAAEIRAVRASALQHAQNTQVAIVTPKEPLVGLTEIIAELEALEYLAKSEIELWGRDGQRRDEWTIRYEQDASELAECLAPVALRIGARLQGTVFWSGDGAELRTVNDLHACVETMMAETYPLTPAISDEVVEKPKGRKQDGTRGARAGIIDKLLHRSAASLLANETSQPQRRLIDALLVNTGVLTRAPRPRLRPGSRATDRGTAEICRRMELFRSECKEAPRMLSELVATFQAPPFGVGYRVLATLFAAALRDDLRGGNIGLLRRAGRGNHTERMKVGGDTLETAFREPGKYLVQFVDYTESQLAVLRGLLAALTDHPSTESLGHQQLCEAVRNAATDWWTNLPYHARNTGQGLSREAEFLRSALQQLVPAEAEPQQALERTILKTVEGETPVSVDQTRDTFRTLLDEIEKTAQRVPSLVAAAVVAELGLDCAPTPEAIHAALTAWYTKLPEQHRTTHHVGDAGRLVSALSQPSGEFLRSVGEAAMGKEMKDWSDNDIVGFAARMKAAKQTIEEAPAPPAPPLPPPPTGPQSACIQVAEPGKPVLTRSFVVHDAAKLSEIAQSLLQLLKVNCTTMRSGMKDGELESVLLMVLRDVFSHG